MEIKTLEDIKELVARYKEIYKDGNLYFTMRQELARETETWLHKYSHSEGRWLDYELAQSTNEPEIYILIFFD